MIYSCCFLRKGFLGTTNTMLKFKMWKRHKSINYRQENAGISCWASKTGSDDILGFTIVFVIPTHPHPEKTATINQLRTGKCWHFLFGEQNRKWWHFRLHHSAPHPEKPPFWENGTNKSITGRKMLAVPVWRAKQEVKPFWTSPLRSASLETPILRKWHRPSNKWQENADTSCFWPILTCGGSALLLFSPGNGHTDTIDTNFVWCVITHDMKRGVTPMK